MNAITVLLVDDHLVVRTGLMALLGTQSGIALVAEVGSGEDALNAVEAFRPDVEMMDPQMGPGMDGIEAIKAVRNKVPGQPVLVFTTYDSDADIVHGVPFQPEGST